MQKVPIIPTMPWQAGDAFSHQGPSTQAVSFSVAVAVAIYYLDHIIVALQAVNRSNTY